MVVRVVRNSARLIAAYVAIIFAIMLLPVFLITNDISLFEALMNFIFQNQINNS